MKKLVLVLALAFSEVVWANDLARLLLNGRPSGHMGMYYQGMSGGAPTFVDANVSLAYRTQSLRGLEFGGSMWAATRIWQAHSGDFARVKENFVITELYGNFTNPNRIAINVGRFATDSEWIKHYTQGASVVYEDIENLRVEGIWAYRNAYVTNYRTADFDNPYGGIGALYLGATLTLPESPLQFTPYIYMAPNDFTSFGAKVLVAVPVDNYTFYGKMHFLSFMSRNDRVIDSSRTDGDGGFIWLEAGAKWLGLNIGGGIISVAENGARGIDSFGQSSYFERREGLFYNNATTLYGFFEYDLQEYIQLDSAIRSTNLSGRNIFNWEVGLTSKPQPNVLLGAKVIGMTNGATFTLDGSIFANDGRNYILTRLFAQVSF